jgi:hypothetical protein
MALSRSARYYQENPTAREKKKDYDTKYHATPLRRAYRSELNKENRKRGTYGNGDGKDLSHTKKGGVVLERARLNRARNGSNGESTKK